MRMIGILDLRNQFGNKTAIIDWLWLQTLFLAALNLFQISLV